MKVRLLHLLVRAALTVERLFTYLGSLFGRRTRQLGRGILSSLGLLLPSVFLFIYRIGKRISRAVSGVLDPAEKRFFAITAHRYTIHVIAIAVVIFATWSSLASATEQNVFSSDNTPLSAIAGNDDETYIDSGFEKTFAEGAPQPVEIDVPQSTLEEDLLTALDGSAVWATPSAPQGAVTRTGIEEYIVRDGDTVSTIAERFGVSPGTILWENKLGPYDTIRAGRKLVVLPVSGVTYTVGKGETLESIAKKFNVDTERIAEYNEAAAEGKKLAVGMSLVIPGGRPYVAPRPIAVAPTPARLTTRQSVPKPASALPAASEAGTRLLWPTVSHHINQYFSLRHTGLDIHGDLSSPIYAADDGDAVIVEYKKTGYGQSIVLDHGNGIRTRYGHMSQIFITQGETVKRGQIIGMLGSTGRSTGPHLHFEVLVAGRRVNPFGYTR